MAQRPLPLLLTGLLALTAFGCADEVDPPDAGTPDAGTVDTGTVVDTGVEPDAGTPDTGPVDTGPVDTGVEPDAGTPDTGTPQSISFIHTNDEHSHFLGFNPNIDDYPTLSMDPNVQGGVHRRSAVLDSLRGQARADGDAVFTVSAGDVPMGSLFHVANLALSPDYFIQTLLGYDVMTLGNHEFDFGTGTLADMISNGGLDATGNPQELGIPLVVSNIRFSMTSPDDDDLAALYGPDRPIRRTWIREMANVKVGFVGVMGLDAALVAPFKAPVSFSLAVDDNSSCTTDADCPTALCIPPASDPTSANGKCALDPSGFDAALNFPALVADIAGAVAELRAQDVDLVVAVSHSGVNEREIASLQMMGLGLENAVASEEIVLARGVDQALTQAGVPGIDVIIGGHSHTALSAPLVIPNARSGIDTLIVQAGQYGEWVGRLRLTRDDSSLPWQMDTAETGLTAVNGSVDTSGVQSFFIDQVVFGVMDALEQSALASPGDGILFPGEQCDTRPGGGLVLPGGGACGSVVRGFTGMLACHANQQLDFSGCVLPPSKNSCGNNSPEGPEQCDGTGIPVTCADLGYTGGTMACAGNCTLDVSGCTVRFPSLLEAALNFELPQDEMPIIFDGTRGDLFFHTIGSTAFDVSGRQESNESNILNLVADANREMTNTLSTRFVDVAIVADGTVRDTLAMGQTGALSLADLFRVVPLGISPQESTPGYSLIDFYLTAPELKAVLEVGVGIGATSSAFWLGVSGARIEYDPSQAIDNRITRIELAIKSAPWSDTEAFYVPLYDSVSGFDDPNQLVHVSTDLYVGLFAAGLGFCPRLQGGQYHPQCTTCMSDADCVVPGGACDLGSGRCGGGEPPAFSLRTTIDIGGGIQQELKEFLALISYVRRLPGDALPSNYNDPVPRRLCCTGNACPADNSRTCPQAPE